MQIRYFRSFTYGARSDVSRFDLSGGGLCDWILHVTSCDGHRRGLRLVSSSESARAEPDRCDQTCDRGHALLLRVWPVNHCFEFPLASAPKQNNM
jgi:hypothetical protein